MATRVIGPTGSRRRRRFLLGPIFLIALVALFLSAGAQAVHDVGLFELDANVHAQAAPGDDWENIHNNTDSALTDTGIVDDPSPQSVFTGGGSKDDLDIPQWNHKDGNVPDKDDITNAYAAAYTLAGDTYVYFGLDRFAVQGSADVGFWFFQGDVAPIAGGTFSGQHEVGDLLVLSEFDQGGGGITIKVFEWVGTGGDEGGGTLQTRFGGPTGAPADCDSVGVGDDVCANVNTAPILDADIPWEYVGKGGTRDMPTAAFFEGGINLDAIFGEAPCFSNVVAETRSSFEVNAVLKDLVHSQFALCEANISIAPTAVNRVGDTHTFTVNVTQRQGGVTSPAPDGTIVDVTLTPMNGAVVTNKVDNCANPGTVNGTCTVSFTSNSTGKVTGHAAAEVIIDGSPFPVETDGLGGNSGDADKRFVDAKIAIAPDDVNRVGQSHTFTVTASEDAGDGNGFVAAAGEHVDFALSDPNATVDADASTCDNAGPNTDANGQCTIVFSSNSTGLVTASASANVSITTPEGTKSILVSTDGTGANSNPAKKRFVDAKIAIAPDDVNRAGESHTFTVTLSKDIGDGNGFVAAAGEHVDFTLSDPNATVDAAASTCDNAGANTDANGQCTIVFSSSSTGLVTGSASATLSITTPEGTTSISVSTDGTGGNSNPANKRFVDAKIAIAPDDVNRVGQSHTFTVTLSKDVGDGNGFVAAAGEHVDFTLSDPNASVDADASTCDNAGPNTDANGQCTIVFSSNSTGLVTASASSNVSITTPEGTKSILVSTDGTGANSNPAKKRFVDAKIVIAPDDTNGITESHTFTVTVSKDLGDGNGFVPAQGEHVDFTLTPSGGAVTILDAAASTCDDAGPNTDANGQCTIVFTSNSAGSIEGTASATISITTPEGTTTFDVSTNGSGGSSGPATKVFVAGTIVWTKVDNSVPPQLLGGATFEVCRTHRLDSSTDPDSLVPEDPIVCFAVADDIDGTVGPGEDRDPDPGEFKLEGLILGTYTIKETIAPPGFALDPDTVTITIDLSSPNAVIIEAFVDVKLFKLIVITCNESTDTLVDSEVTLNGVITDTITEVPPHLTGVTQSDLCAIGGASYGGLSGGTYTPAVELPDVPPLHP